MKTLFLLAFLSLALAQQGSLQVKPLTATLYTSSDYTLSYYTVHPLPSNAEFLLDFTSTYIEVPAGSLNTSATAQNSPVSGATAVCSSKKCTLKINHAVAAFSNLTITFGSLTNPYFLADQPITTQVVFNNSYTEYLNWNIPKLIYTPLSITKNSITQSNYGVGNTNVTYAFNLSLPMTPLNPQLSVTVPAEVDVGSWKTTLSYYNSIQNTSPFNLGKIFLFNIMVPANPTPGIVYLTINGLVNPKSIGSSSSFEILLQLASAPNGGSCSGCTVAVIKTNLFATSTVPGNIKTISFSSSNNYIDSDNTISIYSEFLASIPQGGKYQITLPPSVQPKLPLSCNNDYGFSLTSGSTSPSCSYDSQTNTIFTNNFYFSGTGNAVFKTTIVNPPDTRNVLFTFQTFDSAGNMIGNSSLPSVLTAVPKNLVATANKNVT